MKRPSVKQSMKCQVCSKLADLLADLPPVVASSGQEWQLHISTVGRSTGRLLPSIDHRSLAHNYTKSVDIYQLILADLPPPIEHRSLEYHYTE